MLILALIWALIGGFSVAVSLESTRRWKTVLNLTVTDVFRRLVLIGGLTATLAATFISFYFLVFSNAMAVLIAWVLLFALARIIIELMGKGNVYIEKDDKEAVMVQPEKKRDLSAISPAAAASPKMDPGIMISEAPDVSETAPEVVSLPEEDTEEWADDDAPREDTSDLPEPIKDALPISKSKNSRGIPDVPQMFEPGAPSSFNERKAANYDDIFKRINSDDKST